MAVVWLAAIAALGLAVHARLRISGDLRLFMPAPHGETERLLLTEVSEGPAARLLLVALSGADAATLAASSHALAAALAADPAFRLVTNGESRLDQVPERLLPYRYLLADTLDHQRLDAGFLAQQLREREQDLASPAGGMLEPLLPRDPTLELVKLLQSWQPARQPRQLDDVWFNGAGTQALLMAETAAAAFDPRGQRTAIDALHRDFLAARTAPAVQMAVTGPGAFAVIMQGRSEADARLAGILDTTGMVSLMLLAYRRPRLVVLGALPLATAAVAGLGAVALLFGTVHGITIAFGFTLIGVALDYPIFLFSNQLPAEDPVVGARRMWPTLALAVAAVCIAYLAFLASGVTGLAQLACFNITGLAAAGLTTRHLLPRLMGPGERDAGRGPLVMRVEHILASLPRLALLAPLLAAAAIAALALPGARWDNDLGHLTPVPAALLSQYESLQRELGSPDVRYLLAVDGASAEQVLVREEALQGRLAGLAGRGIVGAYDLAARYLPSVATQERRRAALPDPASLRAALAAAAAGRAFRAGLFEPFIADVAAARTLPALTVDNIGGTPLALMAGGMLLHTGRGWTGLVTFTEVRDPAALAAFAAATPAVALLDLKQAADDLVAHQRTRILLCIAGAALLLVAVVGAALRSAGRTLRAVTPMLLSTLLTLGVLHAAGQPLNLFHLIALVLAAGLGLDYGLFLERAGAAPAARGRALHAVAVCAAAASVVFAVLGSSALPVLRAIGVTVVLGVAFNLLLALLLIRPARSAP